MTEKNDLNLVAQYISTGNSILVLGPNFSAGSTAISNQPIPSFYDFLNTFLCKLGHDPAQFSSQNEIIEYITHNSEIRRLLVGAVRENFGAKTPRREVAFLSNFVWRRIYSFCISDVVDVAYRRGSDGGQRLIVCDPLRAVSSVRASTQRLELVKMHGDALFENQPNIFNDPDFRNRVDQSKWRAALRTDCDLHPVIFLGAEGDRDFLFNQLRSLQRAEGQQRLVFVCPGLKPHQIEMLASQNAIHFDIDCFSFLSALMSTFPSGRTLDEIAREATGLTIRNKELRDKILETFTSLTNEQLRLLADNAAHESGIRSFYRGANIQWSDIVQGIHADLTSYANFRGRIEHKLSEGFPGQSMFLLRSPAGMGRTVGLMSTAYWLRQRTDLPILWLEPDGDFRGFLLKLHPDDFKRGAFVFVDDISNVIDAFDSIPHQSLENICFVASSRETRWRKYSVHLPSHIKLTTEEIRKLNRRDAEEIHGKISQYGTIVYLHHKDKDRQIQEILEKSQKDMLVLIREIGQGKKFDQILRSEIGDLSEELLLVYLVVCLCDRNQVPLPVDLLAHAARAAEVNGSISEILGRLGRIVDRSGNRRTVRTRHATIAEYVLEPRNRMADDAIKIRAVESLLLAFSNFQIPIIVHHSNTGHARVFKSVINRRFLTHTFGNEKSLGLYKQFEKLFELDGFFWQQYGLCHLTAGKYEEAVQILEHALATHEHFQIRHSLGAACLTACEKLGPAELTQFEFNELRSKGRTLLDDLHNEVFLREDIALATLATLDVAIAQRWDSEESVRKLAEHYHQKLAFYLRDYPEMERARRSYDQLHAYLTKGSSMGNDLEKIYDNPYDDL